MADDAIWHLRIGDASEGPLSKEKVMAHLRDGSVDGASLIWRPGFQEWLRIREVGEFWTPPLLADHTPSSDSVPPSVVQHHPAIEEEKPEAGEKWVILQPRQNWSLWGALAAGLIVSGGYMWFRSLSLDGGYEIASKGYSLGKYGTGELIGELIGLPLIFALVAALRNGRGSPLFLPATNSRKRAMAFFALLIVLVLSIKLYSIYYFSRDEIVAGAARVKLVNAFVSGCKRSQRAAPEENATLTDEQIESHCNCIGMSIVSQVTYKPLERFPLDVNRKCYRGFPWARKSDSVPPTTMAGLRDGEGILKRPAGAGRLDGRGG